MDCPLLASRRDAESKTTPRYLWGFCENETSRETNLASETSRETKVSQGLARIVSAIPHLRQIFRH